MIQLPGRVEGKNIYWGAFNDIWQIQDCSIKGCPMANIGQYGKRGPGAYSLQEAIREFSIFAGIRSFHSHEGFIFEYRRWKTVEDLR